MVRREEDDLGKSVVPCRWSDHVFRRDMAAAMLNYEDFRNLRILV